MNTSEHQAIDATRRPIDFITIRDTKGRASSFSVYGRLYSGSLTVVGNLEHNAEISPDSIADADKLIKWLNEWKQQAEK